MQVEYKYKLIYFACMCVRARAPVCVCVSSLIENIFYICIFIENYMHKCINISICKIIFYFILSIKSNNIMKAVTKIVLSVISKSRSSMRHCFSLFLPLSLIFVLCDTRVPLINNRFRTAVLLWKVPLRSTETSPQSQIPFCQKNSAISLCSNFIVLRRKYS